MSSDESFWSDRSPTPECKVCGEESVAGGYLCKRCRRFSKRVGNGSDALGRKADRAARLEALWNQWHPRSGAFVCAYTGIPLSEDPASHRYPRWEHDTPGDVSSVVLVADLIHKMKTSMTPLEFRRLVRALARHYDGKPFDRRAFPADPGDHAKAA
jgi:hypothetical protein